MGPFTTMTANEPILLSVSDLVVPSQEFLSGNRADVRAAPFRPPLVTRAFLEEDGNDGVDPGEDDCKGINDDTKHPRSISTRISIVPYDDSKTRHATPIGATLRIPDVAERARRNAPPSPGGGSTTSDTSIVSVTSISNSDPDPSFSDHGLPHSGSGGDRKIIKDERWYTTTIQVSVPFFIAGIGTIGAGLILSQVQNREVFVAVSELFIMVSSLLGLKGNLDMCLASRLSTQANLGNLSGYRAITRMIVGNVALVQIQAIVAAFLVAVFAVTAGVVTGSTFSWDHALLLCAASICTATSSCFILDFVMVLVVVVSHRCKMNPDNLATPLAASIGDVVSISVLALIATALYDRLRAGEVWILYAILGAYLCALPVWILVVLRNEYTRNILTSGWTPVLSALFISGLSGLVLDQAVGVFEGYTVFQPIVNGIGGNLVSVQASRISTMLHQTSLMGILPPHAKILVSPWRALFSGVPYAKTARMLIGLVIPGQLVFVFVADYLQQGYSSLHVYFVLSYMIVAVTQVMLLLYIAHVMIHAMWRYKIEPDNSAIPYLTALGDLTGSLFLAAAFYALREFGYEYGV